LHRGMHGEAEPNRDRAAKAGELYNSARRKNQSLEEVLFEDECL
jgi:hypothetical protein